MFKSDAQRRAIFAKKKQTPMSRRRDLAYGIGAALVPGVAPSVVLGRAVRRINEPQYSTQERITRRGSAINRMVDMGAQTLVPGATGALASGAVAGLTRNPALGALAGAAAGVGTFVPVRRWVNKRRDKRLIAAGGTVRSSRFL